MRFAQPVLRRMLRMWLAAVCSLMNSVRADLAVAEAPRDEAEDLDLARRQAVGTAAARGAAASERADAGEQRRHADALGQRRRLAEQRRGPVALGRAAREQQRRVLVGGVGEPRRAPMRRLSSMARSKCSSARSHSPSVAASMPR